MERRKAKKTRRGNSKNYLNEEELLALNNLTEQYLIFAQGQAMRRIANLQVILSSISKIFSNSFSYSSLSVAN